MDVNSVIKKELYPIYGLWNKPFWQTTLFYSIIIGIILLAMSFLVYVFIKKYLKKSRKKTAWDTALGELALLKKRLDNNKISSQPFYLTLTELIKNYLSERFGYDLRGYTDREALTFLEQQRFSEHLLKSISDMFESMEVVKFAAKSAAKELMVRDLARSVELIKQTTPVYLSESQLQSKYTPNSKH